MTQEIDDGTKSPKEEERPEAQRADKADAKELPVRQKAARPVTPRVSSEAQSLQSLREIYIPASAERLPMVPDEVEENALKVTYGAFIRDMLAMFEPPEVIVARLVTEAGVKRKKAKNIVSLIVMELAATADPANRDAREMCSQLGVQLMRLAITKNDLKAGSKILEVLAKINGLDKHANEEESAKQMISAYENMDAMGGVLELTAKGLADDYGVEIDERAKPEAVQEQPGEAGVGEEGS